MKAKKDTVKKYVAGGAIQAGLGAAQTVYGMTQLPKARAEFERARAAAPSLETPSQYYENYKNAYDSELSRMESQAIQSNLATSIQALQGAGGRALVGGLGASVAQSQAARNAMLQQERGARLAAGQELARAEEATIGRKEARSQQDINYANQAYQAALGNIGAGIGAMGEAAMYGGFDSLGGGLEKLMSFKRDKVDTEGMTPAMSKFVLDQNAKIRQDFAPTLPEVDLMEGFQKPGVSFVEDKRDTARMSELDRDAEMARKRLEELNSKSEMSGVTEFDLKRENLSDLGFKTKDMFGSNYRKAIQMMLGSTNPLMNLAMQPASQSVIGAGLYNMSKKEHGGMMLEGEFSHKNNPIDIVHNGAKVGEATGQEYIVNPKQAKKIAQESKYAKQLFNRFAKQAKKKK